MTIDEAISFCEEKASNIKLKAEPQVFTQIAAWLEELKSYRASVFSGDMTQKMLKEQYNKGIDDFVTNVKDALITDYSVFNTDDIRIFIDIIEELAEQLKAGDKNG